MKDKEQLKSQYRKVKEELDRITQGTEKFMIKLAEKDRLKREIKNVDRKDNQ